MDGGNRNRVRFGATHRPFVVCLYQKVRNSVLLKAKEGDAELTISTLVMDQTVKVDERDINGRLLLELPLIL